MCSAQPWNHSWGSDAPAPTSSSRISRRTLRDGWRRASMGIEARPERAASRSLALFDAAQRLIPGGVNSPVRAFRGVGGVPRFIDRGSGARIVDADGNEYLDYVLSWGALPLGHAHPAVVEAITRQASLGTSFGAPTELESQLAELIIRAMPAIEMVRFVSSGTEA